MVGPLIPESILQGITGPSLLKRITIINMEIRERIWKSGLNLLFIRAIIFKNWILSRH